MWDAIASVREYQATQEDADALSHARAAFHFVDAAQVFALGACPEIRYQIADGRPGYMLKTLETDANYIKAALLLYQATGERAYLDKAARQYAAVRRHFLDPLVPLYSVYVYDDGRHCTQLPHRFFASVNGDMIWSGVMLARATGDARYRADAFATARAVDMLLGDARGIYANLQAENDVAEPLVEAMYVLATAEHQRFAKRWIERNAQAALDARAGDGAFDRAWDGPPPRGMVSIWRSNGGLSLQIAAAALEPNAYPARDAGWSRARFFTHRTPSLPATIAFHGAGIAIIGTQGERCCEPGHARVFVDGVETFDATGIWQNKSETGTVPHAVLFAWMWPRAGHHVIRFEPGVLNAKEGGAFLDTDGYLVRDR